MDFEFNNQYVPQSLLTIEEIGQCAIEAVNDEGYFYYLVVRTSMGKATFAECGPVIPDVELLPDGFETKLYRMNFDQRKVSGVITKWLNDRLKKLTSAKVIDIEEAISQFRDLGTYMQNYSSEVY